MNNNSLKLYGTIELKLDKDTKKPLEGIKFELYDSKNTLINTYKTNENGKIIIENLNENKNYYLKEVETNAEYKLLKDNIYFDIKYNEITKLEIVNEKIKGQLKVIKVDKEDYNKKLSGVKFDIYDEESNLIETIVTDKNGCAYSSLLPSVNRIYTIVEKETIPGYIKNDEYIFFKLNNSNVQELIIENKKEKIDKKEDTKVEKLQNVEENEKKEEIKVLPRTGF